MLVTIFNVLRSLNVVADVDVGVESARVQPYQNSKRNQTSPCHKSQLTSEPPCPTTSPEACLEAYYSSAAKPSHILVDYHLDPRHPAQHFESRPHHALLEILLVGGILLHLLLQSDACIRITNLAACVIFRAASVFACTVRYLTVSKSFPLNSLYPTPQPVS